MTLVPTIQGEPEAPLFRWLDLAFPNARRQTVPIDTALSATDRMLMSFP